MYVIIAILAFILVSIVFQRQEHFSNQNAFAGLDSTNKNVYYEMSNPICDRHSLLSLQWYTRFPYMIGQRYKYNDKPSHTQPPTDYKLHEFAPLQELPLNLNWPNV